MHLVHAHRAGDRQQQWPEQQNRWFPSNTLPRKMKVTTVMAKNPARPPGTFAIPATSQVENPDCVSAQAIAVAVPTMSITAPVSATVSTSSG
jgi:hypothetical protein